jgi:hypothetical protein
LEFPLMRMSAIAGNQTRQKIKVQDRADCQQYEPERKHGGSGDNDRCNDGEFTQVHLLVKAMAARQ